MPPGIQPPIIVRFNASSVPILQISLSAARRCRRRRSTTTACSILRTQLSTVQGLTLPTPYGGRSGRSWSISTRRLLQAKGISPKEVADAINANNLAFPTGVARIGTHEYPVTLNNTPLTADGVQRHSDQGRQRRDGLHARRRPGPRRLHDADDGRPPQRHARRAGDAAQERQRLDARHRQPGQGDDAARSRPSAPAGPARSSCCSTSRCSSRRRSKASCSRASSPGC